MDYLTNDLLQFVTSQMATSGIWLFGLAMLLGGLGVPLPGMLIVAATGAFVRADVFTWQEALAVGLISIVTGDACSYLLGRYAGEHVPLRVAQSARWQHAKQRFARYGGWAIFFSRWIATPLSFPTNLMAGGSNFGFRRFVLIDGIGELVWLLLYGGAGYLFSAHWQTVGNTVGEYINLIGALIFIIAAAHLTIRHVQRSFGTQTASAGE